MFLFLHKRFSGNIEVNKFSSLFYFYKIELKCHKICYFKINFFIFIFIGLFACSNLQGQVYSDSDILQSFKQRPNVGNCAIISVIKSAIQTFGIKGVFKSFEYSTNGIQLILKNDSKIALSREELNDLSEYDKFVLFNNKEIFNEAKLIYAVVAKKKYLDNPNKYLSLKDAAEALNGSEKLGAESIIEILGYKYRNVPKDSLKFYSNIIIGSNMHAAYSFLGNYDEYGKIASNEDFVRNHSRFWTRNWASRQLVDGCQILKN